MFIIRSELRKLCVACVLDFRFPSAKSSQAMHAGVVRDIEQQRVKKERQADFEMQKALEEEYKKIQQVHDTVPPVADSAGVGGNVV